MINTQVTQLVHHSSLTLLCWQRCLQCMLQWHLIMVTTEKYYATPLQNSSIEIDCFNTIHTHIIPINTIANHCCKLVDSIHTREDLMFHNYLQHPKSLPTIIKQQQTKNKILQHSPQLSQSNCKLNPRPLVGKVCSDTQLHVSTTVLPLQLILPPNAEIVIGSQISRLIGLSCLQELVMISRPCFPLWDFATFWYIMMHYDVTHRTCVLSINA